MTVGFHRPADRQMREAAPGLASSACGTLVPALASHQFAALWVWAEKAASARSAATLRRKA